MTDETIDSSVDDAMERIASAQVHDEPPTPADPRPVVRLVRVSGEPLDVGEHDRAADHAQGGGRVTFCGVVRDHDGGRGVAELEYEGHPSAEQVLREVADEYAALPDVLALAVSHRVGELAVGDVALVAVVVTAHRREAFEICGRFVDDVKHRLPIWKRQVFADGTDEWVNCP